MPIRNTPDTGFDNPHTGAVLSTNRSLLGVSDKGGYVTDWRVRNPRSQILEPILQVNPDKIRRTGIPPLFPNYGPSEVLGQHGFGRDNNWNFSQHESYLASMRLRPGLISDQARQAYPYDFDASIQLYLTESSLGYKLNIINFGSESMPAMPGLHPYFAIPLQDKPKLEIPEAEGFDAGKIDWVNDEPDQEFAWKNPYQATIEMPDRTITIRKRFDERNTQRLVVWSEPGTNYVCVEPVSGKPGQEFDKNPFMIEPKGHFWMDLIFSAKFK